MTMTSTDENPSFIPLPPPVTELTVEQDLKLRNIWDALNKPDTKKDDIITVFMSLQHQNFVLSNSLTNLVNKWKERPTYKDLDTTSAAELMFGILSEIKD